LPSITLGSRTIEYSVIRGRGGRFTYFRFRPDATLEILSPRRAPFDAERAILERKSWILKHYESVAASEHVLLEDSVMYDGRRLRLDFERTGGREGLVLDLPGSRMVVSASDRGMLKELVRRLYIKESSAYVVRALPGFASKLGVTCRRAEVREVKVWGYCTKDGKLVFSWQLIALPERLREYVVCHEVAHLAEHNHSARFKKKLAALLPDFRGRERELYRVVPCDLRGVR
jgi:predicted metal-dependent hydrolase